MLPVGNPFAVVASAAGFIFHVHQFYYDQQAKTMIAEADGEMELFLTYVEEISAVMPWEVLDKMMTMSQRSASLLFI